MGGVVAPRSEDPKLIIPVTNLELVQPMLSVRQRYRQTDGQTDGRLTIAIPRFALRASRGKNHQKTIWIKSRWFSDGFSHSLIHVCLCRHITMENTQSHNNSVANTHRLTISPALLLRAVTTL